MDKQAELDKIAQEIEQCKICKAGKIGKAVVGEGSPNAEIVFLGEAPGKKEAQSGRPFIGPASKVLRKLIEDAGIKAEEVFITSPVKYLPEYVTPTPADVEHGKTHLLKQLNIIKPKVIVLMGRVAALAMLGRNISVAEEHGKIIKEGGYTFLITYHPAAPLYSPKVRVELENDFKKLKKIIKK